MTDYAQKVSENLRIVLSYFRAYCIRLCCAALWFGKLI